MDINRRLWLAGSASVLATGTLPALAQSWPARPLRLLCPYGVGGPSDILTRVLGDFLAARLGQTVVVENKPGAGTRIANEGVAKAAPDGYTLLHAAAPIAIGEALYPNLPYSVARDFAPIVSTAIAPLFLVVNAGAPYRTLDEFVRWGKSSPKGYTFGSPGAGSAPHLTAELFMRAAGARGVVAHYKGDAPATTDLLGGLVDATLTAISTALPHVESGRLRVLAVATEERTPLHPDVPSFAESGMANVVGYGWYGLMAPAATPGAVLQRLNSETNAALADTEVRRKVQAAGLQVRGGSAADFRAFIDSETRKWAQIIKTANIKAE